MEDEAAGRRESVLMATAHEIAEWVGAPLAEGANAAAELIEVSAIENAGPFSLVFATDSKAFLKAIQSSAGLILTGKNVSGGLIDSRLVLVPDARYAFALVADRLAAKHTETQIHATAVVSESAQIGEGSTIGAGAVIGDNAVIGAACEIGPRVTIYARTTIGHRVRIQAGAVLGSTGFGYAKNLDTGKYMLFPQQGVLIIEDDVDIGSNSTIDRGALGETRIGRGSKLDNLVHIGHNCVIGKNVIIAAQTGISGSSVVEDGAILGGQVGIGEHAVVGEGVILGGGAGVLSGKKMRGSGEVFWGRPARPLKEYLKDLARLKKR